MSFVPPPMPGPGWALAGRPIRVAIKVQVIIIRRVFIFSSL
jgi:hypothetical protein